MMLEARWLAVALSLVGSLLLAYMIPYGWVSFLAGSVIWFVISLIKKDWPQTLMWLVFSITNMYGLLKWTGNL